MIRNNNEWINRTDHFHVSENIKMMLGKSEDTLAYERENNRFIDVRQCVLSTALHIGRFKNKFYICVNAVRCVFVIALRAYVYLCFLAILF